MLEHGYATPCWKWFGLKIMNKMILGHFDLFGPIFLLFRSLSQAAPTIPDIYRPSGIVGKCRELSGIVGTARGVGPLYTKLLISFSVRNSIEMRYLCMIDVFYV